MPWGSSRKTVIAVSGHATVDAMAMAAATRRRVLGFRLAPNARARYAPSWQRPNNACGPKALSNGVATGDVATSMPAPPSSARA
jgi:hypothetical protein